MGWWAFKALRFTPLVVVPGLFVTCLFVGLYWILDDGNLRLVLADLVITVAILTAAMTFLSTVVWWVFAMMPTARIYMNKSRSAVIVMTENQRKGRWELKNHVVQHTGCRLGKELREAMAEPMQAAAKAAGVDLYGRAANEKVQKMYLDQFSLWGLVASGKRVVEWKR